jgi:hypothetical protein
MDLRREEEEQAASRLRQCERGCYNAQSSERAASLLHIMNKFFGSAYIVVSSLEQMFGFLLLTTAPIGSFG